MSSQLPAHAARRRPAERLPRQRRRVPPAGGRHEADDLRLGRHRLRPDAGVPAGSGWRCSARASCWRRRRCSTASARASLDYIYRDEIERFAAEGVLNHVHVATSREQPGHREYVQDRIRAQGALVWRLLDAGGYVYVCGAQPMRDAVRAAFVDVVAEHGSMPREHAEAYLHELETTSTLPPRPLGLTARSRMDVLALVLTAAALVMFAVRRQRPRTAPLQRDRARARPPHRRADLPVHLDHEHAHRPLTPRAGGLTRRGRRRCGRRR